MEKVAGSIPALPIKIKKEEELVVGRVVIKTEPLTSWGIPQKYVDRVKDAEIISPADEPAEVVEEEAPGKCPESGCGLDMRYERLGCDGDFCWGFFFCPNPDHQGRVWPTASGPH